MNRILLSNLKEKKKVMKLSMAALVGAMAISGSAALCSASAMAPNNPDESIDLTRIGREYFMNVDMESFMRESSTSVAASGSDIAGEDDQSAAEANSAVEKGAKNRAEKLYKAIMNSDNEDKDVEMLKEQFDVIDEVKQIADKENAEYVRDLVSKVKIAKFCEDYHGGCDWQKGTINLSYNRNIDDKVLVDLVDILKDDHFFLSLDLVTNHIGSEGAKCLSEMLMVNTTLFDLDLMLNEIGDEGAIKIAEMLMINKTLTKLNLNCNRMYDVGAEHLSRALRVNTVLEELDVGCNWTYEIEGTKYITEALMENTTLMKLRLGGGALPHNVEVAKYVSNLLKMNKTLVEVELAETCIGDEGARMISEALMENTTLVKLNLCVNAIGDEGAKHISDMLKVNTTLVDLLLYYNDIGVEGANKISESLSVNTTLENLDLSYNKIKVEGARLISEALKTNSNLTSLRLNNNEIGDEGARMISEALRRNTTLVKLYLYSSDISRETMDELGIEP